MQINLEEAQARSGATELQVFGRFDESAAKLHHGQNMEDVAEQRHKDPQFDKGLRRTFGLGTIAAEWCTTDEILRCMSVSCLVVVSEWQYMGILDDTMRPEINSNDFAVLWN